MGSSERSSESWPSDEEASDLRAGHVLAGRYRIESALGKGGIGVVYRAVQLPLERPVAVKVLHDDLLSLDELRARFEREARVLSALTHPHVVGITDYGIDGERPFLVMELLEGETLEDVLGAEPLEPERALSLARQVLLGLAFAHHKGVAHRDLKPANVFLSQMQDEREHAKLLDFGLARMVQPTGELEAEPTLTKRGVVFGTPAYMSPEQAAGSAADARSDVYSAGVLLFELLTGRRPFVSETRAKLMRAHLTAPVPRLASVRPELHVDPALADVIDVAMAKEPADRYRDAGAMLAALDAIEPPLAWLGPPDETSGLATEHGAEPSTGRRAERDEERRAPLTRRLAPVGVLALALASGIVVWQWPRIAARVDRAPVEGATESGARPPARDPWAEPPPEPLRPFLRMVEDGYVFEERSELRPLFALAREMEGDPRPRLLMGHLFFARGWLTEGIRRYEAAAIDDPSARGDRWMLANLLRAASRESVGERAGEVIETVYGAEALPALEAAIDALEGRAVPQLRLVELRDRLSEAASPEG